MKAELNIQSKKLELIQWLSTIEDLSVLNKIIDLKSKKTKIGGILFLKTKSNL